MYGSVHARKFKERQNCLRHSIKCKNLKNQNVFVDGQFWITKWHHIKKIKWTKVVRLVETSHFDFWIISIWSHMQILEPKYCKSSTSASKSAQPQTVSHLWREHWCNELEIPKSRWGAFSWFWSIKMSSNGKTHEMKSFVFSRRKTVSSTGFRFEIVYCLKSSKYGQVKTGKFGFNSNTFQCGQN